MSNKNYIYRLPYEINALISTFLEKEGDILRKYCGKVMIKEIRDGDTYGNGLLHSFNDIPARIGYNRTQEWYKNGFLHRDNDMPAIIYSNKTQIWYKNGKIHN
jgi:hypothetical protein